MKASRKYKRYIREEKAPWWIIQRCASLYDGVYQEMDLVYIAEWRAAKDRRTVVALWSVMSFIAGIIGGLLIAIHT